MDGSLSEGHQDHLKNAFDLFECPSSQSLGHYHPKENKNYYEPFGATPNLLLSVVHLRGKHRNKLDFVRRIWWDSTVERPDTDGIFIQN